MDRILVLGATGYTGRLVAQALETLGRPYLIAGRNQHALDELSASLRSRPEVRIADVGDSSSLSHALGGIKAVVNTVGPFRRLGLPVVRAAVDLGVHYVDTTGEQTFQMQVYDELHRRAIATSCTVITGAAFEYTFSYLGAALLHERCGPLLTVSSYHLAGSFQPSVGTAKSAVGMMGEEFLAFREGRLAPMPSPWRPRRVLFPGEREAFWAVPFPGGDAVMLPLDIPTLQAATSHVLLPQWPARVLSLVGIAQPYLRSLLGDGLLRRAEDAVSRLRADPAPEQQRGARWMVFVHGQSPSGSHLCCMQGLDTYATSGATAALTAVWLADGRARDAGVMTTGKALPAVEFLDALAPFGVRWELR